MSGQWWQYFFSGAYLDVMRLAHSLEDNRRETDFIMRSLGLRRGMRVLDVPCGNGRITLELALRGLSVLGVDLCAPLLAEARATAGKYEAEVEYLQRDMRDLPWEGEFDALLCWQGSFGYFDDEQNLVQLQAMARALKPGGRLLIDTMCLESLLPRFRAKCWVTVGNTLVLEERRFNHELGRIEGRVTLVNAPEDLAAAPEELTLLVDVADLLHGGAEPDLREFVVSTHHSSLRMYSYRELSLLVEQAGLRVERAFGSIEDEPFSMDSKRLYLVAVREG
ncbi:class I SAM-dependent methyltransferase [bacterium]|nr:class I SAM-dependent methyltransferase [bacterium]